MFIKHIELGNFRKLKAVRVDMANEKTVFVGANNSGKTSAMVAMRRFLVDTAFLVTDLTLTHWKDLILDGESWEAAKEKGDPVPPFDWSAYLPFLDVWINANVSETHYVAKLLPSIEWNGGLIGVRLRYQPKDPDAFQREYLQARDLVKKTLGAAKAGSKPATLWPANMIEFLERRMRGLFVVQGFVLDPTLLTIPAEGIATPQKVAIGDEPIGGEPFKGLIKIDEINAQRGFGHAGVARVSKDEGLPQERSTPKKLSAQMRSYYTNHLDPYDTPEPEDLDALQAMEEANRAFDERLKACFASAMNELESLGYPGVTDPRLTIATRLRATDGLNHDAAVQYEVPTFGSGSPHRLPEDSNGLGYQNLVSMVFDLMSFRDGWMRVGKAGSATKLEEGTIAPLHLVLIEEPEAHLHAQVQQVFIKQAYAVLRNHDKLKGSKALQTQLVVSTHSSHVAHACDFASLRYFRRLASASSVGSVPTACVINLSEVFGDGSQTERFVTRYLKATHCDLFFSDGAVLVEGPAERILVPHFVETRDEFEYLRHSYITWLEIGGAHAHRLKNLIEHLGLSTLIITDLDAMAAVGSAAVPPQRGQSQRARNETLKTWVPGEAGLDLLLDKKDEEKAHLNASGYGVRVAYQTPVQALFKAEKSAEALANTFEDALLYENLEFFSGRGGTGITGKFAAALKSATDLPALAAQVHKDLAGGGKAEFALDLLYADDLDKLKVPIYIADGLGWLIQQVRRKETDVPTAAAKVPA